MSKADPKNPRPTCVNHGCDKPVAWRNETKNGVKQWRVHCSRCQRASYGAKKHADGVTPFKKGVCQNLNSLLGFPCPINYRKAPWARGVTEIDHINGNHADNRLSNLIELCPMCHKRKGRLNKDHNGWKNR